MKTALKTVAILVSVVILLNLVALIMNLLFSNSITGSITFIGTISALIYLLITTTKEL
jgi:hypothetical protein